MTLTARRHACSRRDPMGHGRARRRHLARGRLFFFPVFWMVLNSFKTEADANASPTLFFEPTLDRWQARHRG